MGYGPTFRSEFAEMQKDVYENAKAHGWWEGEEHNDAEKIALMHSELSEALEALRVDNPPSEKNLASRRFDEEAKRYIRLSCVEEELADVVIRIMDYAEHKGFDIATAIQAKHEYNKKRSHRHGGKLF